MADESWATVTKCLIRENYRSVEKKIEIIIIHTNEIQGFRKTDATKFISHKFTTVCVVRPLVIIMWKLNVLVRLKHHQGLYEHFYYKS
jgi:hypothetical protein